MTGRCEAGEPPWTAEEAVLWEEQEAYYERFWAWRGAREAALEEKGAGPGASGPFYPIGADGEPVIPEEEAGQRSDRRASEPGNADPTIGAARQAPRPVSTKTAAKLLRVRAMTLYEAAREDLAASRPIPATKAGRGTERMHLRWDPDRIAAWWSERGCGQRGTGGER